MLIHEIKIVERAEVFLGEAMVCVVYYNMNGQLKAINCAKYVYSCSVQQQISHDWAVT